MSEGSKAQKRASMRRHIRILQLAEEYGCPFTTQEMATYADIPDISAVSASLQFLKKSGAMDITETRHTRNGKVTYWQPTGHPIDRERVKAIHAIKQSESKPSHVKTINNMDKPASYWRAESAGQGQSVRRGFSSLAMVGD